MLLMPALSLALLTTVEGVSFGERGMVAALAVITTMGLVVWGQHLYTMGLSGESNSYFTAATYLIGIPSGLKAVQATATLS